MVYQTRGATFEWSGTKFRSRAEHEMEKETSRKIRPSSPNGRNPRRSRPTWARNPELYACIVYDLFPPLPLPPLYRSSLGKIFREALTRPRRVHVDPRGNENLRRINGRG